MLSVKCQNCAAELSIDSQGELYCPYCGSKVFLSDLDIEGYKKFRLNMLKLFASNSDAKADAAEEGAWLNNERVSFESVDGNLINVDYTFTNEERGAKTYVTKDNVIIVFDSEHKHYLTRMKESLSRIDYPSAALKDLSKCFPRIKAEFQLKDGGVLVVNSKPGNAYPLYAFGNLGPKHVAWIVSRMENFCCVFEYNDMVHGGIDFNSVYINPRTHEAFLYGGWWNSHIKREGENTDLRDLRKVADKVLGRYRDESPQMFIDFLKSSPKFDAYEDFEYWDSVIEKGFGGHKFTRFDEN